MADLSPLQFLVSSVWLCYCQGDGLFLFWHRRKAGKGERKKCTYGAREEKSGQSYNYCQFCCDRTNSRADQETAECFWPASRTSRDWAKPNLCHRLHSPSLPSPGHILFLFPSRALGLLITMKSLSSFRCFGHSLTYFLTPLQGPAPNSVPKFHPPPMPRPQLLLPCPHAIPAYGVAGSWKKVTKTGFLWILHSETKLEMRLAVFLVRPDTEWKVLTGC